MIPENVVVGRAFIDEFKSGMDGFFVPHRVVSLKQKRVPFIIHLIRFFCLEDPAGGPDQFN